ncbi:nucleotidyltransferase family protein [Cohnella fermenti]|uniref:Nucleotidyltransferase family protein n=1 Tax=Cohnella fermenti TaxID=2565925 RepID=A0A4S4C1D3_9BACL|nr:nucleotidyltransferase family protein [Cohnella fermenti]THF81308.1 nucleotidyltransferase family protein [Cohnella fermenti]
MKVTAVYLAAGMSRRMGEPKLSLELAPGRALGGAALAALLACSGIGEIVAVTREEDELAWLAGIAAGEAARRLDVVRCSEAALGMSHSIRCGLERALAGAPDAILIVLADQPFVTAFDLGRLLALGLDEEAEYAACGRSGAAHPPVLFKRGMFAELCRLSGDEGARRLLQGGARRGLLLESCEDALFVDVDTREDWERAVALAESKGLE